MFCLFLAKGKTGWRERDKTTFLTKILFNIDSMPQRAG